MVLTKLEYNRLKKGNLTRPKRISPESQINQADHQRAQRVQFIPPEFQTVALLQELLFEVTEWRNSK